MLSYLLFVPKVSIKRVFNKDHSYETSELWKYGISGDLPILLLKIKDINDIDIVKEALNAYEYFRAKKYYNRFSNIKRRKKNLTKIM